MSTWWPILAVFWALYLADGLRGTRRTRFFGFRAWGGAGGRVRRDRVGAHVAETSWLLTPPLPSAWAVATEDLPASLAPEGVSNSPSVSAGRPPPWPEHAAGLRWEEIERIDAVGGWIRVNGRAFTPETPALTADGLRVVAAAMKPLDLAARRRWLAAWQHRRFRPLRLRRRVRLALARTRGLVVLNTVQALAAVAGTGYLLLEVPEWLSPELRSQVNRQLLALALAWGVSHLLAVVWFFRVHRRFFPKAGQERIGLCFTALLVPAQALRLRQHVVWRLAEGQHPLALAAALAEGPGVHRLAQDTVRDLRWPRVPAKDVESTGPLAAAASALVEPEVETCLHAAVPPVRIEDLLAPPPKDSPEACAYCPRCGDQFTRGDAACPHGIPLQRL